MYFSKVLQKAYYLTLRTQMLMRPNICHTGPSIPVTKH